MSAEKSNSSESNSCAERVSITNDGEYAEASKMSFQDLLKIHPTQTVWGFKFGEEIIAASSLARDKNSQEESGLESSSGGSSPTVIESRYM